MLAYLQVPPKIALPPDAAEAVVEERAGPLVEWERGTLALAPQTLVTFRILARI